MRTSTRKTRICPLCGKTITYTEWVEDGRDWLGHGYGHADSGTSGYECSCDSLQFKQACYNCRFNVSGSCKNSKVMEEYRQKINADMPFNIETFNMKIKHPERSCGHWEVSELIIFKLFKPQK